MADETDPPERDTKDYKFQQLCKVQINPAQDSGPSERGSWIVASSKYGLTVAATSEGFKVLRTQEFIVQDGKHGSDRLKYVIADFPVLAEVSLGEKVTHLALSSDDLTLAVATATSSNVIAHMFDMRSFGGQVTSAFLKVNLGDSSCSLLDWAWNPVSAKLLVTCLSNGRLDMYEISDKLGIRAAADNAKARCVCWSPKGKQLVVGREDGLLVQYDPDLNIKRKWDYPTIFPDTTFQVVDLMWLSTYSFMVAYVSNQADTSDQPSLILVNGSKDSPTVYVNFEDVCFGRGEERERKYFFHFVQKWEMLITGSSNASEISVVGRHLDNKETWERWNLDDSARAECPLTDAYDDTYPLGLAIDFSSQTPIPLGDEKVHPPSPLMLMLSTEGFIIPYYMMYMHRDAPVLTEPAQTLDPSGIRQSLAGVPPLPTDSKPPTAVKNLFGTAQSSGKSLFGTDQSTTKPLFGAGLATSEQSEQKPAFGGSATFVSGQPFNFASSTPKPALAGSFSFASGTETPTAGASTGFGFGQSTGSAPPFSFTSKSTASSVPVSDAVGMSATSGPTIGPKPGDSAALTSGFQFKVGVPVSTQPVAVTVTSKPQQAAATTAPSLFGGANTNPPAYGRTTATFGATTTTASFGAMSNTATFGSVATSTAASFGMSNTASLGGTISTTTLGGTTSTTPFAGATSTTPFAGATSQAAFGAPSSVPAFGVAAPTFGSSSATAGLLNKTTSSAFGASTVPAFSTASFGSSTAGASKGFGFPTAGSVVPNTSTPAVSLGKPGNMGVTAAGASVFAPPTTASTPLAPPTGMPSSLAHPTSTPVAFVPPKQPAAPVTTLTAKTEGERVPAQSVVSLPEKPSSREPEPAEGEASSQSVDNTFSKSIMEEIMHFNQELSDMRSRAARTDCVIGSRDEMGKLKKQTEDLDHYCGEMKRTMQELNKDMLEERAFCLDMFASVEESRMRQQMMTDPKYQHLLKSRPLDPGSAEKLQQLQQQYQVLDQGLRDVDLILDTQWEEYQNRKKNRTNRLQAPTNDAVYRVVKSNHNIIIAQRAKLGQLEERLKQLKLHNQTVAWNSSTYSTGDSTELSTLADSLVSSSPVREPPKSLDSSRSVSSNKLARLRDHLYRRHVPVVKSTRPENLSMSRLAVEDTQLLRSPDRGQSGTPGPAVAAGREAVTSLGRPGEFVGMFRRSTPDSSAVKPGSNQAFKSSLSKPSTQEFTGLSSQKSFVPSKPSPVMPTGKPGQPAVQTKQTGFSQMAASFSSQHGTPQFPSVPGSLGLGIGQGPQRLDNLTGQQQQQQQDPDIVTRMKKINSLKFEDITPSGSENEVEETEDDEYSDDEDSNSSNGQGFGLQYNMPAGTTGTVTATPVSSKPVIKPMDGSQSGEGNTPIGRKLFSTEDTQSAVGFNFNTGPTSSMFAFGGSNGSVSQSGEPQAAATSAKTFSFGQPSAQSVGQFTFGQASSTQGASQFSFGQSPSTTVASGVGGGLQFGQSDTTDASSSTDSKKPGLKLETETTTATGTSLAETIAAHSAHSPNTGLQSSLAESNGQVSSSVSAPTQPAQTSIVGQPSDAGSGTESRIVSPSVVARSTRDETVAHLGGVKTSSSVQGTSNTEYSEANGVSRPTAALASVEDQTTPASGSETAAKQTDSTTSASAGLFGQTSTTSGVGQFTKPFVGSNLFGSSATNTATLGLSGLTPGTALLGTSTITTASGLFGSTSSASQPFSSVSVSSSLDTTTSITTSASATGVPLGQPSSAGMASGTGLFGKPSTATSGTVLVSQPPSTLSSSGTGLFGQSQATPATSGTGLFGKPVSTTTSSGFGAFGQPITTSTETGLFGQPAFGQPVATTTSTGLFGQPAATTSSTGLFGQSTATSSSTGHFGQPAATSSGTGLFGQSTATSSGAGLFGQPVSTSSSTGLFGQSTATGTGLFGTSTSTGEGTNLFGSTPTTTSTEGFGQVSSGGAFGSGGSGFGTATSGSGFGFGQSSSTGFGKPAFGQTSGFGQTSSSGSGFGSSGGDGGMFSGLGGKPSEEKANTNVFGSAQNFGTGPGTSSGLFGSQPQSFGGNSTSSGSGSPFSGSGAFSGGGQGVGSTGFSGMAQQNQGGGFGSAPSFGSSPSFGSAGAFGSAPSFGSPPAFGAGSAGFGSAPTFGSGTAFGSPSTSGAQSTGFAGFAGTGSPTFGALAQSTDAPSFGNIAQVGGGEGTFGGGGAGGGFGSPAFGGGQSSGFGGSSFGSSPSFTGYRG